MTDCGAWRGWHSDVCSEVVVQDPVIEVGMCCKGLYCRQPFRLPS